RARSTPDWPRHGQSVRRGLSRHALRRWSPPAQGRATFEDLAGIRLMATVADLKPEASYRVPHGFFTSGLGETDPAVEEAIRLELHRQQEKIELIASENIVSKAVLEAQGSVLINKYAEGYPGRRYYGGCEYVDIVETLAIERAKQLFGAAFAN